MDERERSAKRIRAKERRAEEGRGLSGQPATGDLPPGQRRVDGLPILDLGDQPAIDRRDWRFAVSGAIEAPLTWDWDALMAQPQTSVRVDIHCVTNWSSFGNVFEGVVLDHLLDLVRPSAGAAFALARGFDGYATNLRLDALRGRDALLCHSWNGGALSREHGGPVRLLVPSLYFWKSAKWLRHLTILEVDQPGFWEARGYHDRGDPWAEERYR